MKEQEDAYWKAQAETVAALREIGIHLKLTDRIEPMKVMVKIRKFWRSPDAHKSAHRFAFIEAQRCIDLLVTLRVNGYEPRHTRMAYT